MKGYAVNFSTGKLLMWAVMMFSIVSTAYAGTASVTGASFTQHSPTDGTIYTNPSSITMTAHLTVDDNGWGYSECNYYLSRICWEDGIGLDCNNGWTNNVPTVVDKSYTLNYPAIPDSYDWWITLLASSDCSSESDQSGVWTWYTQGEQLPTAPHIDWNPPSGTLTPRTSQDLVCAGSCPDPDDCNYYIQFPSGTTVQTGTVNSCTGISCFTKTKTVTVAPGNSYTWKCRVWDSHNQVASATESFTIQASGCTPGISSISLSLPNTDQIFTTGTTSVSHDYTVYLTNDVFSFQTSILGKKNSAGSFTTEETFPTQDYEAAYSPLSFSGNGYKCGGLSLTNGDYCDWQTIAWDSCQAYPGISSSIRRYFIQNAPTCANPKTDLSSPADGYTWSSATTYVTLVWRNNVSVSGSVTSKLYIKKDSGSFILNSTRTDSTVAPAIYLQKDYYVSPGHTYQWYVKSNDSCGNSYTSPTRTFYVNPAIVCPNSTINLLTPTNGEIKTWNLITTNLGWRINLTNKNNITSKVYVSTNGGTFSLVNTTKYNMNPPANYQNYAKSISSGSSYQWKVVINDSCHTATSPTWSFSVASQPVGPTVNLMTPASGTAYAQTILSVPFQWNIVSSTGKQTIDKLFINGVLRYTSSSHAPGTYTYSWPGFTLGASYTAYVNSTDQYGSALSNTNTFSVACTSDWEKTTKPCQFNNQKLVIWRDSNNCGNAPPAGNGTYENCTYCETSYGCSEYEDCTTQATQECLEVKDSNNCCALDSSFCGTEPDKVNFNKQCYYSTDETQINKDLVNLDDYNVGFLPDLYRGIVAFFGPWFYAFIIIVVSIMFLMIMLLIYSKVNNAR